MKQILLIFILFGVIACGSDTVNNSPTPTPPQDTPETGSDDPSTEEPEPSKPKPLFSCNNGNDKFNRFEIWWSKSTMLTDTFQGDLEECENNGGDGLALAINYPGEGTTIEVEGKVVTMWMIAKFFDVDGNESVYYQYSDFINRSSGCQQGMFQSTDGEVVDIKIDEPNYYRGVITVDGETISMRCK